MNGCEHHGWMMDDCRCMETSRYDSCGTIELVPEYLTLHEYTQYKPNGCFKNTPGSCQLSQHPLFVNGPRVVQSRSVLPLAVTNDMMYQVSSRPEESITSHAPSRKRKSPSLPKVESIVESHLGSRKTTFSARSTSYRTSSQTILCSVTSAVASSTNARGSRGFWNKSKEDWSTKLWLPTKTDSLDSAPNSLNGFSNVPVHGSSFSIKRHSHPQKKSLRTSWQSYTYSLAGSTAKEDTMALGPGTRRDRSAAYKGLNADQRKHRKRQFEAEQVPSVQRMRCVPMKLLSRQHRALCLWFKDARWTYNCALSHVLKNKWHTPSCTMSANEMEAYLVSHFVSAAGLQGRALLRTRTPKVIRQQSVKSLLASIKMIRTKRLKDPQAIFRPEFKDGLQDSIRIESKSIRRVGPRACSIFKNWTSVLSDKVVMSALGPRVRRKRTREYIFRSIVLGDEIRDEDMQKDFSIHFKHGRFTLQLPRTVVAGTRASVPGASRVVAIDPGVRRFATTYSPEGSATIYGNNTSRVLDRLSRRIDRTKTTMARSVLKHQETKGRGQKSTHRTRLRRSKRRYYSALRKAKNVVKDFHYKVSHDLLTRHDTVICPTTSSHRWRQGSLPTIVKRRILLLSFGKFGQRPTECAAMYKNKTIVRGSEAYTSKQCGRCGTLNDNLGSSSTFTCGSCTLVSDRDIHAARNILLRFIE